MVHAISNIPPSTMETFRGIQKEIGAKNVVQTLEFLIFSYKKNEEAYYPKAMSNILKTCFDKLAEEHPELARQAAKNLTEELVRYG